MLLALCEDQWLKPGESEYTCCNKILVYRKSMMDLWKSECSNQDLFGFVNNSWFLMVSDIIRGLCLTVSADTMFAAWLHTDRTGHPSTSGQCNKTSISDWKQICSDCTINETKQKNTTISYLLLFLNVALEAVQHILYCRACMILVVSTWFYA